MSSGRMLVVLAAWSVAVTCAAVEEAVLEGDRLMRPADVRLTTGQSRQFEMAEAALRRFVEAQDRSSRENCARDFLAASNAVKLTLETDPGFWRIRATMALAAGDNRAGREAARKLQAVDPRHARSIALLNALRERGWHEAIVAGEAKLQDFELRSLRLRMVAIAPGEFEMGELRDPQNRRLVRITRGYWIGATEITNEQWRTVMGRGTDDFAESNVPKVGVTWSDAMEFCRRLTAFERTAGSLPEGYEYALPTEAQWEYAARAGVGGPDQSDPDVSAWHAGNSGGKLQPVGVKQPNAWGIHGMLGNASEWCRDWFEPNLPRETLTDPTGPASGTLRIVRGGNYATPAALCRPSQRGAGDPTGSNALLNKIGFRVALVPHRP